MLGRPIWSATPLGKASEPCSRRAGACLENKRNLDLEADGRGQSDTSCFTRLWAGALSLDLRKRSLEEQNKSRRKIAMSRAKRDVLDLWRAISKGNRFEAYRLILATEPASTIHRMLIPWRLDNSTCNCPAPPKGAHHNFGVFRRSTVA